MLTFHIVTLFPESFDSYLHLSIIGRAIEQGKIAVRFYNPRDFTKDPGRRVDRRPYGGGPGMVLGPEPVIAAAEKAIGRKRNVAVIFLSAGGRQFGQSDAQTLARRTRHIIIIAGRYEGIDVRVQKALHAKAYSIGPYVLTGGELPAMTIIDAVSRHVPGVLGKGASIEESRITSHDVYTRPDVFVHKGKKYRVPRVLLTGHHKKINEWKQQRNK